ncbi:class C sortase [Coprococcus catus]
MKKKKSNYFITVILILMLLAGLSLLLYPSVSDYWNSFHQSQAISQYSEKVKNLDKEMRKKIWEDAQSYNQRMKGQNKDYTLSEEEKAEYESMLNVDSNGIMGYVEIPKINCSLPIYHGTTASVLQTAIGHLEWSSLPVGGESTHCVLSGHRGLPSAKLFTNLDKLQEGDVFMLRVLDEVLTYEVDQILIVEPQETGALRIEEGKDYCTLVTCTPYGINTHRLLVRGHRIENVKEANKARVAADAVQIEPLIVAPAIATPMLLLLLVILLLPRQRKKNHGGDDNEDF